MSMANNEHLPIFRVNVSPEVAPDSEQTWGCTCGHIDPYVWSSRQTMEWAFLDHVIAETISLAGLTVGPAPFSVSVVWD